MAKGIYIGVDNIARKVKKMYIGKNEELQVLDYIESTGTQYIDTEIVMSDTKKIKVDFQFSQFVGDSSGAVVGAYNMTDSTGIVFGLRNSSNVFQFAYGGQWNGTTISGDLDRHIAYLNYNGQCLLDGTVLATASDITTSLNSDVSIKLLSYGRAYLPSVKIYSCQIYDGDVLVRDFVPIKDEKGVYCLYDKISQRKFLNSGTGEFIGGEATTEKIDLGSKARKVKKGYIGVKETYKFLEYIETTGTQYIDTGYKVNEKAEFIVKGCIADTENKFLFGCGVSGKYVSAGIMTHTGVYRGRWRKDGNSNADVISTIPYGNTPHTFKLNKTSFYIDDVLIGNFNSTYSFTENNSLYIFGWNTNGIADMIPTAGKIYTFKIYDDGVLVRDYKPCYHVESNRTGLYDVVEGKFYPNKGTENFTAGNETGEIIEVSKARKFYSNLYPKYVKNITRKLSMEYSAFGALKEYILCTGGRDTNGATTASVEGYTKEGVQHVLTSLTQKRERHTCKALGDYMLVIGGATATSASSRRITNTVETYNNNLVKGTASAINKAVFDFGVGANDVHLIQAGGSYYTAESNQAQSYDKNLVKTSITILSEQKQFLSGGNVGEFILFLGGTPKNNNIDIYDNKNVRTTISRPSIYANNVRDINGASTGKNLFYFCGQVGTTSTYYDKLLAFDENLIQKTATLPAKSSNCNAFNAGDEYVVASIGTSTCIYNNNMVLEEQTTKEKWLGSPLNRSCASNEEFAMTGNGWGSETELFNF